MKLHNKELLYGLSEFYKIFGDQTRLRILDALTNKPLCVNEISEMLDISQSAISHQLKNLRAFLNHRLFLSFLYLEIQYKTSFRHTNQQDI